MRGCGAAGRRASPGAERALVDAYAATRSGALAASRGGAGRCTSHRPTSTIAPPIANPARNGSPRTRIDEETPKTGTRSVNDAVLCGAELAHVVVVQDERERRPERRQVDDRGPGRQPCVGELAPARHRERQQQQRAGGRGVRRRDEGVVAGDQLRTDDRVDRPRDSRPDEDQVAREAAGADGAGRVDDDHEAAERDCEPQSDAKARPLAEHAPGEQRRQDRDQPGDEDRAVARRCSRQADQEERLVSRDPGETERARPAERLPSPAAESGDREAA